MLIKKLEEEKYEEFNERGARKTFRKKIIDERFDSFRFFLRYYKIEVGGMTPYDIHNYEHIIIVTKGEGSILTIENGAPILKKISKDDVIFIKANEPHQIINTGNGDLEYYCFRGNEILYGKDFEEKILQSIRVSRS